MLPKGDLGHGLLSDRAVCRDHKRNGSSVWSRWLSILQVLSGIMLVRASNIGYSGASGPLAVSGLSSYADGSSSDKSIVGEGIGEIG